MAAYFDLTIHVEPGGYVFARRFTRFVSALTDTEPLIEELVTYVQDALGRAFDSEGASSGSLWAPLSEAYRLWKARHYPGRGILVRTGRLRASLTGSGGDSIRVVAGRRGEVGTNVPYAIFHQGGTSRMPARPIIRLSSKDRAAMTLMVHRYLVDHAAGRLHL